MSHSRSGNSPAINNLFQKSVASLTIILWKELINGNTGLYFPMSFPLGNFVW
ncbi:hypothetical protein LEMLEM_LOCUS25664, partial [Lemmus lemmus]